MQSDEISTTSSQEIPFIYSLYAARSGPSVIEVRRSRIIFDTSGHYSNGESRLSRISHNGPGRIADRGPRAWIVVLGSFMIRCFCFAPTEFIFGIFEQQYSKMYPSSSYGSIALIRTLGSSMIYFAGFFSGFCADKFGYRLTGLLGTGLMTLALLFASFSHQIWQLYITQGVLLGIGSSLVYYPAIGAPPRWFNAKRGLALGIAVSGTGVGGLVLVPCTQAMVDSFGISWTLRILALICVILCGGACLMIEIPELTPASTFVNQEYIVGQPSKAKTIFSSFFSELKIFKDPEFLCLTFAQIAACIGLSIPLYYFQTYATFIGLTPQNGAVIAGISSGSSCIGRIVLGLAADRSPKTIIISSCAWITAISVLVILPLASSFTVYLFFGLVYGFFSGTYFSLIPLVLSETFGAEQIYCHWTDVCK